MGALAGRKVCHARAREIITLTINQPGNGEVAVGHLAGGDFVLGDPALGWAAAAVGPGEDDPVLPFILRVRHAATLGILE